MRKTLLLLILGSSFTSLSAQTQWSGLFIRDKKIGYSSSNTKDTESGKYTESLTILDGAMLGFDLEVKVTSRTWADAKGRTTKMDFKTETGGKVQKVVAVIEGSTLVATSEMDGRVTKKEINIPAGKYIFDDPLVPFLTDPTAKEIYVFDPNTLALVVCKPERLAPEKIATKLGEVTASVVDMHDPRAPMKVYVSSKGDLLKAVGPFGMETRPLTEAEALAPNDGEDIALASSIKPNKPIEDFLNIKKLKLKVSGADLSKLPSDSHQTVTKQGNEWIVEIHPTQPETITSSNKLFPSKYASQDVHIPSNSKKFADLAKSIVGKSVNRIERAEKLRKFVYGKLKANAGIGVLRDADDILASGDGVCRDHAILLVTLLRANDIPCRLVSGMVYGMGAFYYHAWAEVWTGEDWLGLDSTRPTNGLDATHIKVAQGTVEEAFTSFLIDGAKIEVISP